MALEKHLLLGLVEVGGDRQWDRKELRKAGWTWRAGHLPRLLRACSRIANRRLGEDKQTMAEPTIFPSHAVTVTRRGDTLLGDDMAWHEGEGRREKGWLAVAWEGVGMGTGSDGRAARATSPCTAAEKTVSEEEDSHCLLSR